MLALIGDARAAEATARASRGSINASVPLSLRASTRRGESR